MTANQIAYWNLQESKRANRANEGIKRDTLVETNRSNLANEELKREQNVETKRSNLVREAETMRSNKANENIKWAQHAETQRSNLAKEGLQQQQIDESVRHNLTTETQAQRELSEQRRHSQAVEAETHRANVAKEEENYRHDTTTEYQTYQQYMLNAHKVKEDLKDKDADRTMNYVTKLTNTAGNIVGAAIKSGGGAAIGKLVTGLITKGAT